MTNTIVGVLAQDSAPFFTPGGRGYASFDEGVAAVVEHHRLQRGRTTPPKYRVYRCDGPGGEIRGMVEILDNFPEFSPNAIYKIITGVFTARHPVTKEPLEVVPWVEAKNGQYSGCTEAGVGAAISPTVGPPAG